MKKKFLAACLIMALGMQMFAGQSYAAQTTETTEEIISGEDYSYVTAPTAEEEAMDDPEYARAMGQISDDFYSEDETFVGTTNMTSPYTGGGYNHNSRFDGCTIVNGVDVSKYQKDINWAAVKASGIDFAFIRVGYRGYEKGTLAADSYFDRNMKGAIQAGVKVGIYIFSQAITEAEAIDEANYVISKAEQYRSSISMPIVLDYEYASTGSGEGGRLYNAHLSRESATAVCNAFNQKVWEAGYTPMVYANKYMLEHALNAGSLNSMVWLANYTSETTYPGEYQFWQYSSKGSVSGISGNTDVNFWYSGSTSSAGTGSSPTNSSGNWASGGKTDINVIGANADQETDESVKKMRVYNEDGSLKRNQYYCDGTYTYYLQNDGSPMVNRLTYDPEGTGLIYFDAKGHMVFDAFQYCKNVGYTCYFDSRGRAVFDQITFYKDNVYYLDGNGAVKHQGWFQFENGVDYGYANDNGTLMTGGFSYDQWGRMVFFHWNGMVARGLITDGVWFYHMDEKDGHFLGKFR